MDRKEDEVALLDAVKRLVIYCTDAAFDFGCDEEKSLEDYQSWRSRVILEIEKKIMEIEK